MALRVYRVNAVKALKVFFHGAPRGDLTYYCGATPVGRDWFWDTTVYRYDNFAASLSVRRTSSARICAVPGTG